MESSQQFHLKWNNHSLNTLSSFQHLLDTNTLVDVSLTCCNGKTVTAHRMVLAACSEYFYRLFKELPEKHPVIVFKDANEEIIRDLLLFMYRGEVEVQESHLNDFLKFADTLQVKGLSQSEREDGVSKRHGGGTGGSNTPTQTESPIKSNAAAAAAAAAAACALPDMTKSYLAAAGFAAGKFPPMFPLPTEPSSAADLLTHLSSPNLYRALHTRKYGHPLAGKFPDPHDNPVLKNMPSFLSLKKMFGGDAAMAAADLAALYPRDDNDNDSIAERSPPIPPAAHQASNPSQMDENGDDTSPMESDYNTAPNSDANRSELNLTTGSDPRGGHDSDSSTTPSIRRGGSKQAAGRGSRLERMIAAEYKIMSEYAEQNQELPVMTPELMKSRRTHSLQLAIGEILHNRASVQSAATKYHIPRETLRRHYQRYLKAMGIQRPPGTSSSGGGGGGGGGVNSAAVRAAVATNNNAKPSTHASMDTSADESSNGFSSLMDIGQAYGIWNTDLDGSDFKSKMKDETMRRAASAMTAAAAAASAIAAAHEEKEEKEKDLIIDEDDDSVGSPEPRDDEEDEEDEEEEEEEEEEAEVDEEKEGEESGKGEEGREGKGSSDPSPISKATLMEPMA